MVTFIANYLTTTLPNQMSVNDLDHVLQVENQLGRLQALLQQVSSVGAIGAQITQPVTLGSQGLPPFADADSGAIGALNGSSYSLSYSLEGPGGTVISPTVDYSAGINVHLYNTYAPAADIAFDSGAIVYAQPGGVPLLVDDPDLSVGHTSPTTVQSVSLWLPYFVGAFAGESGIGTSDLSARQISLYSISLTPATKYTIENNTNIVFSVATPFATGWWSYYNSTFPSSWISCTGHGCYGFYSGLGDFGTVTLTIPTGTQLTYFDLQIATFAFQPI